MPGQACSMASCLPIPVSLSLEIVERSATGPGVPGLVRATTTPSDFCAGFRTDLPQNYFAITIGGDYSMTIGGPKLLHKPG